MKNEKGFTLIELLAVIIILGILMLVAIPSVTTYINSSRKSAYVDTAQQYIKAAVNLVNQGKKVQFYEQNTLLLIPVGHDDDFSMVTLESGGQSPYNSTWYMAYVGVVYNNESYDYYFMGVDESGQGIKLVKQDAMEKSAEELVLAGQKTGMKYASKLHTEYIKETAGNATTHTNGTIFCKDSSNCTGTAWTQIEAEEMLTDAGLVKTVDGNKVYSVDRIYVCQFDYCPKAA